MPITQFPLRNWAGRFSPKIKKKGKTISETDGVLHEISLIIMNKPVSLFFFFLACTRTAIARPLN